MTVPMWVAVVAVLLWAVAFSFHLGVRAERLHEEWRKASAWRAREAEVWRAVHLAHRNGGLLELESCRVCQAVTKATAPPVAGRES